MTLTTCADCGAAVPDLDGPTHAYMGSSPGCWQLFGDVVGREFSDPGYGALHRLTVDAYAVQHPDNRDPRNRQSVAVHLISLYLSVERGMAPEQATRAIRHHVQKGRRTGGGWPWLEPPASPGAITVADVVQANSADEHLRLVGAWARSVWDAWAPHHEQVRAWAGG